MRKALKVIAVSVGVLLALPLILFVVLLLVNLKDAPLDPRAARLLEKPRFTAPPAGNGYALLYAMGAPAADDARKTGESLIAAIVDLAGKAPTPATDGKNPYEAVKSPSALPKPDRKALCPQPYSACAKLYVTQRAQFEAAFTTHAVLLARYAEVRAAPQYEEVSYPDPMFPIAEFTYWNNAFELELARAVLLIEDGRIDEGLALISASAGHSRSVTGSSRHIIGRVMTWQHLYRTAGVVSELLGSKPALAQSHAVPLRALLAPFAPEATDLSAAVEAEHRGLLQMAATLRQDNRLRSIISGDLPLSDWHMLFYQPHDTVNSLLPLAEADIAAAKVKPADLAAARANVAAAADALKARADTDQWRWSYIYNPAGKTVASISQSDWLAYKLRAHDIDGYLRLVRAKLELLAANVPPEGRTEWLKQSPPETRSPYDGSPMTLDAKAGTLGFTGQGKHNFLPPPKNVFSVAL